MNLGENMQDTNKINIPFFSHKVVEKRIVFTLSCLVVFIQPVKAARCKTKIRDALLSQKRPIQAEVLLSL